MNTELRARFPRDFVWGAATSAYQIEGAPLADGAGPSNWHQFCSERGLGHIWQDHDGDIACDHYYRYRDDVHLMAELGLAAYRFSLSWSRILPEGTGAVNQRGLDFYRRLLDSLQEKNIQPMVTLFHWDLPLALAGQGGWLNPAIVDWFGNYARVVFDAFADRVPWWATINEPWVVSHFGFLEGTHPPGIRDARQVPTASANLLRAHAEAVKVYRQIGSKQIGLVVNLGPEHAASDRLEDQAAASRAHAYLNQQFLQPALQGSSPPLMREMFRDGWVEPFPAGDAPAIDFVGVNYYTRQVVRHHDATPALRVEPVRQEGRPHTEMGWEVYPAGLTETVVSIVNDYGPIPIYITENGAAFDDRVDANGEVQDVERVDYLRSHLNAAADAIAQGVPLRGYFAWSLLDNFEWTYGYSKRFGLVYVDYATQRRTIKDSGKWYSKVIALNCSGVSEGAT